MGGGMGGQPPMGPPNSVIPHFPSLNSTSSKVKEIQSSSEWNSALASGKLVVVDFFATWCGPCKMVAPKVEALASKYPAVMFIKVDVDRHQELAHQAGVSAMPTFHLYHNRSKLEGFSGADANKLEELIIKHQKVGGGFSGTGHKLTDPSPPSTSSSTGHTLGSSSTSSTNFGGSGHKLSDPSPPSDPAPSSSGPNELFVSSLVEMGFPIAQARSAVTKTNGSSLEAALDWCMNNPAPSEPAQQDVPQDKADDQPKQENPEKPNTDDISQQPKSDEDPMDIEPKAKSFRCAECGIVLANQTQVGNHAKRTGHSDFEEDTQEVAPKKPLTPEEKEEQKRLLQEKLQEIRKQKEEDEKKREIEREKNRVKFGKETGEAKRQWQEKQIQLEAEKRRREKEEDRKAKEKIKKQIELDKLNRKKKQSGQVPEVSATQPQQQPESTPKPTQKETYDKAVVQIRMPQTQVRASFEPKDSMRTVFAHVEMLLNHDRFVLLTTFPRKTYKKDDFSCDVTLEDAELVPNGTIVCQLK